MRVFSDVALTNFKFWSGGKDRADVLTYDQLYQVEEILEDLYPDGCDATTINDLFWFEEDTIAEWLGFKDFEELEHFNNGEEKVYTVVATRDNLRVVLAEFDNEDDAADYASDHEYEVMFGGIDFDFELDIEESWV